MNSIIEKVNKANVIGSYIKILTDEKTKIMMDLRKENRRRICTIYGRKCIITNIMYDTQDANCVVFYIAFGVKDNFWQDTQTATVEKLVFTDEFYTTGDVNY